MNIRLSSFKRSHGIRELLSPNLDDFWASDDCQPHAIQISFAFLTYIEECWLYLSYTKDDSYTPQEIEVRSGLTEETLEKVVSLQLCEPEGYNIFVIKKECLFLQIIILNNHQDGKDCHIRSLKLMENKEKELYIKIKDYY